MILGNSQKLNLNGKIILTRTNKKILLLVLHIDVMNK